MQLRIWTECDSLEDEFELRLLEEGEVDSEAVEEVDREIEAGEDMIDLPRDGSDIVRVVNTASC